MKHYPLYFILALLIVTGCTDQNEIKPQRKDIVDAVFGSGHIENRDQYAVTANTDGYLKEAYVAEGDTVKQGEKLNKEIDNWNREIREEQRKIEASKQDQKMKIDEIEKQKQAVQAVADKLKNIQ